MLLILFPLCFLLVLTVLSSIFTGVSGSVGLFNIIDTTAIINGTTTSLQLTNTDTFNFDPLLIAITWIIVITVLAGVVSINVVGTGLNASGSKIIVIGTAWSTAYIFLGISAYPLIMSIPLYWGELLYICLTVVYAFGVFKQIGGS